MRLCGCTGLQRQNLWSLVQVSNTASSKCPSESPTHWQRVEDSMLLALSCIVLQCGEVCLRGECLSDVVATL